MVAASYPLNPFHNHGSLTIQFFRVPFMALLLAVLQPAAFVVLQHAVFPAVVAVAKTAVADDALCRFFAVLVRTADFPSRHTAAEREGDVDGGQRRDV